MLETLTGDPVPGMFSARRLRRFTPGEGTPLAEAQKAVEERCAEEEKKQKKQTGKKPAK